MLSSHKLTSQGDPVNTVSRLCIDFQDIFTGIDWFYFEQNNRI